MSYRISCICSSIAIAMSQSTSKTTEKTASPANQYRLLRTPRLQSRACGPAGAPKFVSPNHSRRCFSGCSSREPEAPRIITMDFPLVYDPSRPDARGGPASKAFNSGSKSWQQNPASAHRIAAAHNAQMGKCSLLGVCSIPCSANSKSEASANASSVGAWVPAAAVPSADARQDVEL